MSWISLAPGFDVLQSSIVPFSFSPQIFAELNNYKIELYGFDGKNEYLEACAQEIVAGDLYLIQGHEI